jgi:hypothetical protein
MGWAQSENGEQQGTVLGVDRRRSHHQCRSMFLVRTQWEGILDALAVPRSTGHRAPPGCAGRWLDRCPPGRSVEALPRQGGRDDYHRREDWQAGATRDPHLRTEGEVRSGPVEVDPITVMAGPFMGVNHWMGCRRGLGRNRRRRSRRRALPACPGATSRRRDNTRSVDSRWCSRRLFRRCGALVSDRVCSVCPPVEGRHRGWQGREDPVSSTRWTKPAFVSVVEVLPALAIAKRSPRPQRQHLRCCW